MLIEVFSARCAKCRVLEVQVRRLVADLDLKADIHVVHDLDSIRSRGLASLPALVMDGDVVLSGELIGDEELAAILLSRARLPE